MNSEMICIGSLACSSSSDEDAGAGVWWRALDFLIGENPCEQLLSMHDALLNSLSVNNHNDVMFPALSQQSLISQKCFGTDSFTKGTSLDVNVSQPVFESCRVWNKTNSHPFKLFQGLLWGHY